MESIVLKQTVSIRPKLAFGLPLLVVGFLGSVENLVTGILLIFLAVIIFGLGYNYIISKDFINYRQITVFTIPLFKIKMKFLFPDYISLFHQSFIQTNNRGFVPNTLNDAKYKSYTIKFFKGNQNIIVFESPNKNKVLGLGSSLSEMLDVELYNTLK